MKTVALTRGMFALVDDVDFAGLAMHKWQARKHGHCWYATRDIYVNGKQIRLWMHRVILNAPPHVDVDHANGNGLDNQRGNLRLATDSQNQQNRKRQSNNTSGFRGVTFNRAVNKWQAGIKITLNRIPKNIYLGLYSTAEDAARAYDIKAVELFGDFANTNFPKEVA